MRGGHFISNFEEKKKRKGRTDGFYFVAMFKLLSYTSFSDIKTRKKQPKGKSELGLHGDNFLTLNKMSSSSIDCDGRHRYMCGPDSFCSTTFRTPATNPSFLL